MENASDKIFMQRCLQLAKNGLAAAMPNPSVGAVLVHEKQIIAEGYTSKYGGPHAEVNCLRSLQDKSKLKDSILYVSLEPCSHQGKTPPCVDLIIASGIKKVVIGASDPNPVGAGGSAILKEAGIDVIEGVLEGECKEVNKRFYIFHQKQRPYIILKWAQTSNGLFAPLHNEQFWITNTHSKQLVHRWRSQEQAILVGDYTVKIDDPQLNVRLVTGRNPVRVVLGTTHVTENNKVFIDAHKTIFFTTDANFTSSNSTNVVCYFEREISIQDVLKKLYELHILSVIVEGGLYTLQQFIDRNLWDEARILVGLKVLKEGRNAPNLDGEKIKELDVSGDTCLFLKNINV